MSSRTNRRIAPDTLTKAMLETIPGAKLLVAMVGVAKDISGARIIEALVIAGITAASTGYIAVQVLDERVRALDKRLDAVEKRAEERNARIESSLQGIYTILASTRPDRRTSR